MVDFNTIKIGFPNPEVPGTPMTSPYNTPPSTNSLLAQVINLQQVLINLKLQDQFYHMPNPNKVAFKMYSDTQTGITTGTTTIKKVIYPKDVNVMKRRGLVTHLSVYTSGDVIGQTGIFSLYDNGSPMTSWQNVPVNTASSYSGEGLIKLPVPIELITSHALQYSITNNSGATLDYFIIVWGYDDIGYFMV